MASISDYGLPESIEKGFKSSKTQKLFEWQQEALATDGVLEGKSNLLYSAPTSAGKTLVSDILVSKKIADGKKALVVFPFVALGNL